MVIQANYMSWFLPSKSRRGKIGHRLEVELSVSQDDHVAEGQVGVGRTQNAEAVAWAGMYRELWGSVLGTGEAGLEKGSVLVPGLWMQPGTEFSCPSSLDPILTFSSMSVLVTSTSSAKPTSLSRLIPRPSLSKTFQVNRQPSSATLSRNWSSKVSDI